MKIIDRGGGTPLVIVPGIQGRWEWMKPAVDALATRCHVVTFSLADEPSCRGTFDTARGFSCYVEQIREALDQAGLRKAAVCGVSYGGLIAAAFAACHPDRVSSLVLVSALPPSWKPNVRARLYLRAPRLLMPLFLIASLRMYPEIAAARGGAVRAVPAAARHAWNVLTHMFSPARMARRVRLLDGHDARFELSRVHVPTLVITGEGPLDRVVPVEETHEYLQLWPHAQVATLARTGHLGLITRAEEFAAVLVRFIDENSRRVGQVGRRFG